MSTRAFVRKPRITPPRMPGGDLDLQPPPEIPRVVPGGLLGKLMPVVMVVAMLGMVGLMFTSGVPSNPTTLLFPGMMVVSMLGMLGSGGRGNGKKAGELNEERKDYFRYLGQVRDEVRVTGAQQRAATEWSHPDPKALIGLVGGRRMWERRAADPDFCNVRLGFGHQRLATKLASPETGPLEDLEPIASVSLRRFVRTHSVVHGLATAVSLRGFAAVSVDGDRAQARALVRSMVCQLCTFQGPDHVLVAVVTSNPDGPEWSWTKWLPHNQHPSAVDGLGSARLVFASLGELESALAGELEPRGRFSRNASPTPGQPQLVIVFDDGFVDGDERILAELGLDAVTVLDLAGEFATIAARRGLQLTVADGQLGARTPEGVDNFGAVDQMSTVQAEVLGRCMASYRVATAAQVEAGDEGRSVGAGLMGLLGIPDAAAIDPEVVWRPRSARERLRVPIGVDPNGVPVEIDIKEAAENGMGPHGLCIGATGSGKSEFLRTLVLGMVTTHSPDALNLVLVDFKGGATFLGLDDAPHVAAVITNLEEELSMVDRMKDALSGEMNRRQELLRAAGNFANVTEYEKARAAGAALDPLPALFIVVDEFSELLSQKPDFADLFVAIGRLGRSLHMHLLLASQRLEEGKLRGLDSHLSYRIGLKTFSANESRTVLGVPDAYHLPSVPGSGYLKCDSADPIRFNASYVSGPYSRVVRRISVDGEEDYGDVRPKLFTASTVALDPADGPRVEVDEPAESVVESAETKSLLDVVVDRLRGRGRPAHEVWLDPLEESPTLSMLLPDPDWRSPRNRHGAVWAPIGVVDRPYDQRRDVLTVDLSGAQGHLAVVGGPQAGKSTALRSLIMAMALTHTPQQVQFYCLDFGGGTLTGLADVPHVGSVTGRLDQDRVRRTVAEVATVMRQREERFRELGIDSMREFRRRKAAALAAPDPDADPVTADPFGDVFLVIDGWGVVRQEYEALEPQITALAGQGLSYGVHVVLAASRWAEIRPALKDLIGTKVELRLGDPADSEMGRRLADLVPVGRPGRGLTREGLHMLIGLPRVDSRCTTDDLAEGVGDAVAQLGTFWDGHRAPPVRMLPDRVPRAQVVAQVVATSAGLGPDRRRLQVPIGIDEAELAPVCIDFAAQQNFLAFADSESGKTTLLRNVCMGLMDANTSSQAKIILVDYRRTMLGVVEGDHLAGYAASADQLSGMITHLCEILADRMPGPDTTQQQMRDRSWWSGPEVFLVVDDYDMVATASGNPLAPLVDYLASARDLGLHLVIARRSGGASRAMFDPVIGRLKDLSVDGLVMNGSRDEGNLLGTVRPSAMPPGRGTLVTRARGAELVQISYLPPL